MTHRELRDCLRRVMSAQASKWHECTQPVVAGPRPLRSSAPPRILLAEDNPVNQKVARGALEKMRCSVDIVTKPLDREVLAESIERLVGSAVPPVDWEQFVSLTDGDGEFAEQLIQLFIDSGDAALAEIREALAREDWTALGRAAHSDKGSSANIRAQAASDAAARLEQAVRAGEVGELARLEQELRREARRATEYLRTLKA